MNHPWRPLVFALYFVVLGKHDSTTNPEHGKSRKPNSMEQSKERGIKIVAFSEKYDSTIISTVPLLESTKAMTALALYKSLLGVL